MQSKQMLASNYRKFPDALIAQRELELVFPVCPVVSEAALETIRATFNAGGEWIRSYAKQITLTVPIPAWFQAMRKRAIALAKAVKAAIKFLF